MGNYPPVVLSETLVHKGFPRDFPMTGVTPAELFSVKNAENSQAARSGYRYFVAVNNPPKTKPKPLNRYQFDRPPGTAPR